VVENRPGGVPEDWISCAASLADTAGEILRRHFRTNSAVETKDDGTPVTPADREVEEVMRTAIEAAWPGHGIRGEEFRDHNAGAETVWVLDPIDGTKSFLAGVPLFTTLIAVVHRGVPVLGVIDQAVTRERWTGAAGLPTRLNGAPQRVRACKSLDSAALHATGTDWCAPQDREAFERLRREAGTTRFSADAYAFGLLASGHLDLAVECELEPHDFCALVPVVEGAGGRITDWNGEALDPARPSRILAAGDAGLHERAMKVLRGAAGEA
jgi:inositol-phosphate phosphatase/L-galactose 1-phosphate phosphatase/histidinol-phosphatase